MRKMICLVVLLAACGGNNHAPKVTLVKPSAPVSAGEVTEFQFRVDDADGDVLGVILDAGGPAGPWGHVVVAGDPSGWSIISHETRHPAGTLVYAWFRGDTSATVRVIVGDRERSASLYVPVTVTAPGVH